jgi:hypothetical protein
MEIYPIRQAIDLTLDMLTARAAGYRNLVASLSLGTVTVLAAALLLRDWRWVSCFSLSLAAVSGWLWSDALRLRRWGHQVTLTCTAGGLPLETFQTTLTQMRQLPQDTIAAMLPYLQANDRACVDGQERLYALVFCLSAIGSVGLVASTFLGSLWLALLTMTLWGLGIMLGKRVFGQH